jgi:hypothetical protein
VNRKLVSTPKVARAPFYIIGDFLGCCGASSLRRVLSTNSFDAHRGSSQDTTWHRRIRDPALWRGRRRTLKPLSSHRDRTRQAPRMSRLRMWRMDSSKSSLKAGGFQRKTSQHIEGLNPSWPKWLQECARLLERDSRQHPRCRRDRRAKRSKGLTWKP